MKTLAKKRRALLLGCLAFSLACKTPPVPPEILAAERLESDLRAAGVFLYSAEKFLEFQQDLRRAKAKVGLERAKFGWFRNYDSAQSALRVLIRRGDALLGEIRVLRTSKSRLSTGQAETLRARAGRLKQMTGYFNESGPVRKNLSQAEIKLAEADLLIRKETYDLVAAKLAESESHIRATERAMIDVLSRYLDPNELEKWRTWARETIGESKTKGSIAFLVSKLERKLTIYKAGVAIGAFEIGLGRFGLSPKLYSGDEATPEGRYVVVQRYPASSYYKALLINYPNEDDKINFAAAKKMGSIPADAGIGGAIEIHGGGKDNLTKGCVGMENGDMDKVYDFARPGTRVTIVGAVSIENTILAEIKKFENHD